MCGRFGMWATKEKVAKVLDMEPEQLPLFEARYNVAPSQSVLACRLDPTGSREVNYFDWGLIPFWAKDDKIGRNTFNARSETVAEKPTFREAFKHRRCLVPVSCYYEWKKEGSIKQPYRIRPCSVNEENLFVLAGLWERWQSPHGTRETFTILTTDANEQMKEMHHRMPVVLTKDRFNDWLKPSLTKETAAEFLKPFIDMTYEEFELTPVDRKTLRESNEAELF